LTLSESRREKEKKTQNLPEWIGLPEYIVGAKGYFMLKYTWYF
jgi:hypothetical protein